MRDLTSSSHWRVINSRVVYSSQAILDQVQVHLKPSKWKCSGGFIPVEEGATRGAAGLGPSSEGWEQNKQILETQAYEAKN